jgi:hypothetical protein
MVARAIIFWMLTVLKKNTDSPAMRGCSPQTGSHNPEIQHFQDLEERVSQTEEEGETESPTFGSDQSAIPDACLNRIFVRNSG